MGETTPAAMRGLIPNPMYVTSLSPSLVEFPQVQGEAEWVAANVELLSSDPTRWLTTMVAAVTSPADVVENPARAVAVAELILGAEPIFELELWVAANLRLVREMGPRPYLHNLLAILKGAWTTRETFDAWVDGYRDVAADDPCS